MVSNLINQHFLSTGESLTLANVMKIIGGQKDTCIDDYNKSIPKVDEALTTIESNCKKSEEDMEKHEQLLEGVIKDYKSLLNINTQLKNTAITLQRG